MLYHIYHSHVGSCNLSSIRIIIYSAAEAKNCWYSADKEASPVSGLWPFLSKMMITQYRSLVLENHFGLMRRKLHCQQFHRQQHLTLIGPHRHGAFVASSHLWCSPQFTEKTAQSLSIQDVLPCNEFLQLPKSHFSVWSPKVEYIYQWVLYPASTLSRCINGSHDPTYTLKTASG